MAALLGYSLPAADGYGHRLVEAGRFAKLVARTETFRRCWPDRQPLWVLSALCWIAPSPDKPKEEPPDFSDTDESELRTFLEGGKRQVTLRLPQRSGQLIKLAKELAWQRDRSLPCEVCGFSFVVEYGPAGDGVIEAHHGQAVATFRRGHITRVEDIHLICANCHRMLHRGEETLTVEDLKKMRRR
jgi:predicted HNH restriction endonuclease